MLEKETRIWVKIALIDKIKTAFPETNGMTYVVTVDWALRKLLIIKKEGKLHDTNPSSK